MKMKIHMNMKTQIIVILKFNVFCVNTKPYYCEFVI